jgi:6-phosphogluconolactonase
LAFAGTSAALAGDSVQVSSLAGQANHWNSNAETYCLTGEGMGKAVVEPVPKPSDRADGAFHVYAPSRVAGKLLIVQATPSAGGLSLRLAERVELGFPAATITGHLDKPLLYVAAFTGEEGKTPGAVVSLGRDGGCVRHAPVTFRHGYSYLSLDRAGRFLLGADYVGGYVDVYALDEAGTPGKRAASLDEGRRNAHCVLPSPDNRFVYIPYVKETNAIFQYRFDSKSGRLTALDAKNANPPQGTGPRHLAYHPNKPIVYFSNEQHLGVSVYDMGKSGALKLRQVCDAVGKDGPKQGVSSSDIAITPDGRFLFAGIRGHQRDFDWISRYRVKADGDVELLGLTPADKIPWGLALSPDGRYLLATAYEGATLTAFRIGNDGDLTKVGSLSWDKNISDLVTR